MKPSLLAWVLLSLLCLPHQLFSCPPLPARKWHVQAAAFTVRFDSELGFSPGMSFGFAAGCELSRPLTVTSGFTFSRSTRILSLIGASQESAVDFYQAYLAIRPRWRFGHQSRFTFFADAQAGLLYLRPHALTLTGGTVGRVVIQPPSETKFNPAWGIGAGMHITRCLATFLQVKQNFMRLVDHRIGEDSTKEVWRSFWQAGAGVAIYF